VEWLVDSDPNLGALYKLPNVGGGGSLISTLSSFEPVSCSRLGLNLQARPE
jgi:hypothetical protein